jgi:putative peptidoglycan lipid II flippase
LSLKNHRKHSVNQEAAATDPVLTKETAAKAARPRPSASLSAVGFVSLLTLVQLLLQFAIQLLLARYFGTESDVDAFTAAVALPIVIAAIVSGSLGYVLVPVIAGALARQSPADAAAIARQIGLGLLGLSLALTAAVAVFAVPLTSVLYPGFASEERMLAARLLRLLSLLIVGNCLIAYLHALSHSFGRFVWPAWAGVLGTGVTLVYVLSFHEQQQIFCMALGMLAGALVTIVLLLPLFLAQLPLRGTNPLALHAGTLRCLSLLAPLVLGAVVWRLDPLVDRFLGSYLDQGTIAQMGYASRLTSGLMLIGTSGLSIVAFPAIAAHAAAGRRLEFSLEVAHALRFLLFLMIPVCVGVSVFAIPVVRLLFEYGKFTPSDTAIVAWFVTLSVGAILGFGLGDVLSRTCYADQDTRTPVVVNIATFLLAVALKCGMVVPFGAAGLVAATSIYALLNILVLGGILVYRLTTSILHGTAASLGRSLFSSLVACVAAAVVLYLPLRVAVLLAAAAGAIAYLLVMWLLRDEFAVQLVHWLRRKAGLSAVT